MEIKRLSAGEPGTSPTADSLFKLPARFVSIGILSHVNFSPHPWKASQEDSDATLEPLLGSPGHREKRDSSIKTEKFRQSEVCARI